MAGQIAIFEGHTMPRKRKKSRSRSRGGRSAQQRRFGTAARKCARKRRGSFRACMKRELKGKRTRRRRRR